MKKCKNCGENILSDTKYCPNCGFKFTKSVIVCSNCGSENKLESSYCIKCGEDLKLSPIKLTDKNMENGLNEANNNLNNDISMECAFVNKKSKALAVLAFFLFRV